MKSYLSIAFLAITASSVISIASVDQQQLSLRITTTNARREGKEECSQNKWKNRRGVYINLIQGLKSDVIGFQETIDSQIVDLQAALPMYGWCGQSRGSKAQKLWHKFVMKFATDEYNPIFYNKSRLTLLATDTFGINPDTVLPNHMKDLPRICTWALLKDNVTGIEFYAYNTHLDHKMAAIREQQLAMIFDHINNTVSVETPVILMGDLNTEIVDSVHALCMQNNCELTKTSAQLVEGPRETRTGWNDGELKEIDHIFVRGAMSGNELVLRHAVIASPAGVYPSDHRPVCAEIVL